MKRLILAVSLFLALPAQADELFRMVTNARVYYGSTSAVQTNGILAYTHAIRLVCTTDCWLTQAISGVTPHASTVTGSYLPANTPWTMLAEAGAKIAVTQDSAQGYLSITELSK